MTDWLRSLTSSQLASMNVLLGHAIRHSHITAYPSTAIEQQSANDLPLIQHQICPHPLKAALLLSTSRLLHPSRAGTNMMQSAKCSVPVCTRYCRSKILGSGLCSLASTTSAPTLFWKERIFLWQSTEPVAGRMTRRRGDLTPRPETYLVG